MILQALDELYTRMPHAPKYGFARKPVSFTIVLDQNGALRDVQDERTLDGKRLTPKYLEVTDILKKRSVGIQPNLACDNSAYVLGSSHDSNSERVVRCFESFIELHLQLAKDVTHPVVSSVVEFLRSWQPDGAAALPHAEDLLEGGNIAFRLQGAHEYFHDVPAVGDWWRSYLRDTGGVAVGQCLVTGERGVIAELHPAIKGVQGAQSTGGGIVSCNLAAFESYGKTQNLNAPVGTEQAFRYTTAVNWLLTKDARRRIQIGDTTIVFWTARPAPIEDLFGDLLVPSEDADLNQRLERLFAGVREGQHPTESLGEATTPFYVLGLSPNAARLAVRLFRVSTVEEITRLVAQHFEDLRIVPARPSDEMRPFPPLWLLLMQTAVQGKGANIPPQLAGALMRAILTGGPYPISLLQAVIRRIRAETGNHRVEYLRAALIKACLNRKYRTQNQKEVSVSLDVTREESAYRLGRMFAVLEIVQKDALNNPNSSITDRFYSAASATPAVVFPRLIRLSQHHLGKLSPGARIGREKLMQEIMDVVETFPAHFGLEQQGLFALGYYHQKKDCYTKKPTPQNGE